LYTCVFIQKRGKGTIRKKARDKDVGKFNNPFMNKLRRRGSGNEKD